MIERIKKIIELKQMNAAQFADEIGVQRSALSHVLSGRNNPSLDFMLRIKKQFPEINLDWLLIGSGNMMENVLAEKLKEQKPEKIALEIEFPDKDESDKPAEINAKTEPEPQKAMENLKNNSIVAGNKIPKKVILLFEDNTFELFDSLSND